MASISSHEERAPARTVENFLWRGLEAVRWCCFWAAILLPFLWAGLLFRGVLTPAEVASLAVLVGGNLLALIAGHNHRPGWSG